MASHTVLVTGATEGIGRALAFALGGAGYAVGVTARTGSRVDALCAELAERGIRAAGRAADVSRPDAVAALVDHVTRTLGPIDTLVNNAGIMIAKPFSETPIEDVDAMLATNVRGMIVAAQAVVPAMIAAGRGDIVNIASLAGKHGVPGAAVYSATKHAVLGLSRSLMLELRSHGIRVVAVCPGSVDTPLMREQSHFRPNYDRILTPDDVAHAVLSCLALPARALLSELDVRPANP